MGGVFHKDNVALGGGWKQGVNERKGRKPSKCFPKKRAIASKKKPKASLAAKNTTK